VFDPPRASSHFHVRINARCAVATFREERSGKTQRNVIDSAAAEIRMVAIIAKHNNPSLNPE